jgi:hypothetical protein
MLRFGAFMGKTLEGAFAAEVEGKKFGGRLVAKEGTEAPYGEVVYGVWYWATGFNRCQLWLIMSIQ